MSLIDFEARHERKVDQLRILSVASVILALVLCLVSIPALSQIQSCRSLQLGPQRDTVQRLFTLSQIAERPEDRQPPEKTDCSKKDVLLAPAVPEMTPIPVRRIMPGADNLRGRLRDIPGIGEAFIEPSRQGINVLHVGCKHTIFGTFDIDLAVEMRFFRQGSGADVVQLEVVHRPQGGTSADWVPVIQPPHGRIVVPGTDVVALPGTDSFRLFWSNFGGETCAFPAAKFTIYAMCEHANREDGNTSGSSLRTEEGKPTLVGHSLGGAAAQFIASSQPSRGDPNCPGVNAFSFGSTGLTVQSSGVSSAVRGNLISYASECDWLVQRVFSGRSQPGRVITLSRTNSHFIDGIQDDICECLSDEGNYEVGDYRSPNSPPLNRDLCR